jgi:hypothetical protein
MQQITRTDQKVLEAELFAAIRRSDLEQVKALVARGVNVNARGRNGNTPLMMAARNPSEFDMIRLLVESGALIKVRNNANKTVLDQIAIPPAPPETWENGYEAWTHCDEIFVLRYLMEKSKNEVQSV